MDLTERTIDSREVFRGRIIRVRQDTVRLPNGKESSREVVEHPGGVGILAIDGEDRVVLVRQYRYAFERVLTEEEGEEIRSIKEALLRHSALGAAMSGSGPTVFGLFDDRQKAVRAKEALEGRYRQTYLAAPVKILEKME